MPVLSLTLAFIRAVVMVRIPAASVTQKGTVPQVADTDSDAFVGSVEALVN